MQTRTENIRKQVLPETNTLFSLSYITEAETLKIIRSLKNKRTTGPDGISSYLIKKCARALVEPLTYLINMSLSEGVFPNELKTARVKPI